MPVTPVQGSDVLLVLSLTLSTATQASLRTASVRDPPTTSYEVVLDIAIDARAASGNVAISAPFGIQRLRYRPVSPGIPLSTYSAAAFPQLAGLTSLLSISVPFQTIVSRLLPPTPSETYAVVNAGLILRNQMLIVRAQVEYDDASWSLHAGAADPAIARALQQTTTDEWANWWRFFYMLGGAPDVPGATLLFLPWQRPLPAGRDFALVLPTATVRSILLFRLASSLAASRHRLGRVSDIHFTGSSSSARFMLYSDVFFRSDIVCVPFSGINVHFWADLTFQITGGALVAEFTATATPFLGDSIGCVLAGAGISFGVLGVWNLIAIRAAGALGITGGFVPVTGGTITRVPGTDRYRLNVPIPPLPLGPASLTLNGLDADEGGLRVLASGGTVPVAVRLPLRWSTPYGWRVAQRGGCADPRSAAETELWVQNAGSVPETVCAVVDASAGVTPLIVGPTLPAIVPPGGRLVWRIRVPRALFDERDQCRNNPEACPVPLPMSGNTFVVQTTTSTATRFITLPRITIDWREQIDATGAVQNFLCGLSAEVGRNLPEASRVAFGPETESRPLLDSGPYAKASADFASLLMMSLSPLDSSGVLALPPGLDAQSTLLAMLQGRDPYAGG